MTRPRSQLPPSRVILALLSGGLVLGSLVVGCTRSHPPAEVERGRDRISDGQQERRPVVSDIATVSEVDGQIVVELGVGSADEILPGDLFRVYGTDPDAPLKGMLQVTDVLGEHRSLARQIGLLDRSRPVAVADEARLVRHLSIVEDTRELERDLQRERERLAAEDDARGEEFQGLRDHYRRRLDELEARHRTALARLERIHEEELRAAAAGHRREIDRLRAEHRADLAALRATLSDEASAALRQNARDQRERIETLESANAQLRDQVAAGVVELEALQQRIRELHAAREQLAQAHATELAAERETREVLEQRVVELERRVAGRAGPTPTTVLTNDGERDETVLERLERVSAERDAAAAAAEGLRQDLAHQKRLVANAEKRLAELQEQVRDVTAVGEARAGLQERLDTVTAQRERLEETAADLELRRLQAQRSYLDLAARVLRLEAEHPAVSDLQDRLRRMHGGEAPAPDTDPAAEDDR